MTKVQAIQISPRRAEEVLKEIDRRILLHEKNLAKLATLILEAKQNAYWTERGFKDLDEWVHSLFGRSRSQYFKLTGIAEELCPLLPGDTIEKIGSTRCEDLVRVKKHLKELPQEWVDKALKESSNDFKKEVKAFISSHSEAPDPTDPKEFISFYLRGGEVAEVREALDIMGKILGEGTTQSFRLWLIVVDWLAGHRNEDQTGPISGRNNYILTVVLGALQQAYWEDDTFGKRLIGGISTIMEDKLKHE